MFMHTQSSKVHEMTYDEAVEDMHNQIEGTACSPWWKKQMKRSFDLYCVNETWWSGVWYELVWSTSAWVMLWNRRTRPKPRPTENAEKWPKSAEIGVDEALEADFTAFYGGKVPNTEKSPGEPVSVNEQFAEQIRVLQKCVRYLAEQHGGTDMLKILKMLPVETSRGA